MARPSRHPVVVPPCGSDDLVAVLDLVAEARVGSAEAVRRRLVSAPCSVDRSVVTLAARAAPADTVAVLIEAWARQAGWTAVWSAWGPQATGSLLPACSYRDATLAPGCPLSILIGAPAGRLNGWPLLRARRDATLRLAGRRGGARR